MRWRVEQPVPVLVPPFVLFLDQVLDAAGRLPLLLLGPVGHQELHALGISGAARAASVVARLPLGGSADESLGCDVHPVLGLQLRVDLVEGGALLEPFEGVLDLPQTPEDELLGMADGFAAVPGAP